MEFEKKKITGIEGPQWVFLHGDSFTVVADRRGIQFQGDSPWITTQAELEAFAKVIAEAWVEHHKLKKSSLVSPYGG